MNICGEAQRRLANAQRARKRRTQETPEQTERPRLNDAHKKQIKTKNTANFKSVFSITCNVANLRGSQLVYY